MFQQFDTGFIKTVDCRWLNFRFVANQRNHGAGHTTTDRKAPSLGAGYFGKLLRFTVGNINSRSNKHGADFFKRQHIVDIGVVFCLKTFGQARTDKDGRALRLLFFQQLGSIIHRRSGVGNKGLDFRYMNACRLVVGRAAGGGHHFFALFHFFDKFSRFFLGGDVGSDGHFHHIGKAQFFQGTDQVVNGAGKLSEHSRCQHGNYLSVVIGQ